METIPLAFRFKGQIQLYIHVRYLYGYSLYKQLTDYEHWHGKVVVPLHCGVLFTYAVNAGYYQLLIWCFNSVKVSRSSKIDSHLAVVLESIRQYVNNWDDVCLKFLMHILHGTSLVTDHLLSTVSI